MFQDVNAFFTAFGASVVVPVMIFIIALFLKVQPKMAMMSALYAGVGLTGFGWIISEFTPVVTKIIKQMVSTTGIKLPVVDIGWQAGSLASFGSTVGLAFFVFGLLFELLIFALGITKVFMASNLWNNFGFMIWGTMAYYSYPQLLVVDGVVLFYAPVFLSVGGSSGRSMVRLLWGQKRYGGGPA